MSINRYQLTQNRDHLILNLESHLDKLRQQRSKLLHNTSSNTTSTSYHRQIIEIEPSLTKYQLEKSITENKQRLMQLEQKYKQKKMLESQYQISYKKLTKPSSSKINQQLQQQQEIRKRKIIAQEMKNAEKYLDQQRKTKKQMQKQQRELYKSIIQREKGITVSQKLNLILKKDKISLIQEEFMLTTIFTCLKNPDELVQKTKLRDYFVYNPEVSEYFHITKRQLNGDIMVQETKVKGQLSYRQFFQLIKSIQISYRSLNPSKIKLTKQKQTKQSSKDLNINKQQAKISNYNQYLTQLFTELDKKKQKIVLRELISKSIGVSNLKINKYYEKLDKPTMRQFQRRMLRVPKLAPQYYKQLSLGYLSRQQLLNQFKQFYHLYQSNGKHISQQDNVQYSISSSQLTEQRQQSVDIEQPQQEQYLYLDKQQTNLDIEPTNYQQVINRKQLQTFDKFYSNIVHQNKQQIYNQKIDHVNIANQFNKLEKYISYMDGKMNG